MSSKFWSDKVSRTLKYIILMASNRLAKYDFGKYRRFIPQTRQKRWMFGGYVCWHLTLIGISLANSEVRQHVLYPLMVIFSVVLTKKVFDTLVV